MIIWGIRTKSLTGENLNTVECPKCGNRDFLTSGLLRYMHIFWIPLFVVGKKPSIQCSQCQKILEKKELTSDLKKEIKSIVFTNRKTMPKNFGIIAITVVLAAFSLYVFILRITVS